MTTFCPTVTLSSAKIRFLALFNRHCSSIANQVGFIVWVGFSTHLYALPSFNRSNHALPCCLCVVFIIYTHSCFTLLCICNFLLMCWDFDSCFYLTVYYLFVYIYIILFSNPLIHIEPYSSCDALTSIVTYIHRLNYACKDIYTTNWFLYWFLFLTCQQARHYVFSFIHKIPAC